MWLITHFTDKFRAVDALGKFLYLLLAISGTLTVFLLSCLLFHIADTVGLKPSRRTLGVINQRYVVSSTTRTTPIIGGKVMVPVMSYYPQERRVNVKLEGKYVSVKVSDAFWNGCAIGDKVEADWELSRITKAPVIFSLRQIEDQ